MNIGHQRNVGKLIFEIADGLCSFEIGHGQADNIAAGRSQCTHLRKRGRAVVRVGIGHRLDGQAVAAADADAAD